MPGTVRLFVVRHTALVIVLSFLFFGAVAAILKLNYLGTTHSSDYDTYILTAEYLRGEAVTDPTGISIAQRILKPLYPGFLALARNVTDYFTAALIQAVVFYFLFIIAMFLLAREFFENLFLASITVLLTAFSYPVLKYGIDVYTETGAWCMYALSLYLTVKFLRAPSLYIFFANVALITIGFLWKEYIVVAAMIFGLGIILHNALSIWQKTMYVFLYGAIFLAVQIPWQLYILSAFNFSYLDWYVIGGADGFSYEFTLKNIVKSTAALIGVMWLFVPLGLIRLKTASYHQKLFAYTGSVIPLIGYAWGFISSRLLYVIAPPMLLVSLYGISSWKRSTILALALLALAANVVWLLLSHRISL